MGGRVEKIGHFVYGCVILSLETLPPGDSSGGVVYLRIVLFPEEASQLMGNSHHVFFYGEGLLAPRPTHQAGGPPLVGCPHSIYSQLPSIVEAIPPSAT